MGEDVRFYVQNRVELIALAALPAAGAWTDIAETPTVGYSRATLELEYDEGAQAANGAVDIMIYYSKYALTTLVPATESEWIPFAAASSTPVVSGADTTILAQAALIHFDPVGADQEPIAIDMSWPSYVERLGVRVRESGDVAAPGDCRVGVQLSLRDGASIPLLNFGGLNTIAVTVAQLPAALGQTTMANSLSVTMASDQTPIEVESLAGEDSGFLILIDDDEQVDQNEYGTSVEWAFGQATYGYMIAQSVVSELAGTGAVQLPSGVIMVFDSNPSTTAGDASLSIAQSEKLIGQFDVIDGWWVRKDAVTASLYPCNSLPIYIPGLSSVWLAWQHRSAASFNDAGGDDELLKVRCMVERRR